jgi:hypothetical protein
MFNLKFNDPRLFAKPEPVRVEFARYGNGRVAIKLFSEEDRAPWITASVNLPDVVMEPDCIAIQNHEGNTGIAALLVENGILEPYVIDIRPSGFVSIPIYRLTSTAISHLK